MIWGSTVHLASIVLLRFDDYQANIKFKSLNKCNQKMTMGELG